MPRGGSRPGAGRKPDPNSKRQKELATRGAKKPAAKKQAGRSLSEMKEAGAPEAANWPFGTKPPDAPKEPEQAKDKLPAGEPNQSPLEFLLGVMRNPEASVTARMTAAIQAAPYVHPKLAPAGKKEAKREAAKGAAGGRFAAAAPPKLAAANGKRV